MTFDFTKTLALIKGGLLDHQATWAAYLAECPGWKNTLVTLTGPLLLANVVLSLVLSRIMGTMSPFSLGGNWFTALLAGLVLACVAFVVVVSVVNVLAGVFGGQRNFSRAFAAVSLAAIPAWVAGIVGAAIPWLGGLVSLAGAIVTLVFLYRIIPLALEVPGNKRAVHFGGSIVAVIVINMVIGGVLSLGGMGAQPFDSGAGQRESAPGAARMPGMFGEMGRQAELMAKAGEDSYQPPGDGKVTPAQARWFAEVLAKANKGREDEAARLQKLTREIENKDSATPADLARLYKGLGSAVSMNNVEMEVVKTGGGNWAEYQWIREQLQVARLQQGEGSAAIAHNYGLYQEFADVFDDSF